MKNITNKALWVVVGVLGIAGLVGVVSAYSGGTPKVVVEGDYIEAGQSESLGGSYTSEPTWLTASDDWMAVNSIYEYGDLEVNGTSYFDGTVNFVGDVYDKITSSNIATTSTLDGANSGTTYYLTGSPFQITLPTTSTANIGATYRFVVAADLTVTSTIVTAGSTNSMEGALIVAGAVVGCEAEDTLTIGAAFDGIGDYVELTWQGTYWMLGDSGFQTASSLTCTAT